MRKLQARRGNNKKREARRRKKVELAQAKEELREKGKQEENKRGNKKTRV